MIRDQTKDAITQKDELVEEMVKQNYNRMRELGEFETVHEIFGKLPLSRIEKEHYMFLFDSVRQSVIELLNRQQQIHKILEKEHEQVRKIEVKTFRDKQKGSEKIENKGIVVLGNYDFSYLAENCFDQKPPSGKPIFKSIAYLRNQDRQGKQIFGEMQAFIPDQHYINFREIKYEIGDIRLLVGDEAQLKRYEFQFADENKVQFSSRSFPSNNQIDKRADTLAKLYLLHMYREQGRKAKQIYKSNQIEQNKKRQIKKIRKEMDIQKIKEGEMIEEMDLIKQVYKILMLIEKKMNQLAFKEFQGKNGDSAALIKRSLEKLKKEVHQESSAKNKLKILITYKHKKGW